MIKGVIDAIRRVLSQWAIPDRAGRTLAELVERAAGEGVATPKEALSVPAVWRAVSLISSSLAQIPLHLYRTGEDRQRIESSPELELLARPAPGVTQYTLRRTLTLHALLCGDGFAWVSRRNRRLVVLDPSATTPLEEGSRLYWKTRVGDQELRLADADVLHICGLSWTGLRGINPIEIFSRTLDLPRCLTEHARGFFNRGTMLSGFLKTPRVLTPQEREELRRSFQAAHAGTRRSWEVALLSGGLEWQPAVVEPQKTQLPELHQEATREVAAIFGVPPHKLGDPTRTSYASLEQENLDYLMFSLESWLAAWESELNAKLCPPDCYWEHNRNALVRSVYTDRVQGYYRMIEMGVLSPNEVRRMENLPARQGGDSYYVPANWTDQG